MGQWQETYKAKLASPAEAAKEIRDGDRIFCSGASSTPDVLMDAVFDRAIADEVRDVRVGLLIALAPVYKVLRPELQKNILIDNYYATPLDRAALQEGLAVHTPFHFSEFSRQATQFSGYNIGFLQSGPMDKNGWLNCGLAGNCIDTVAGLQDLYLQVNDSMPRIHGQNFVHISQVHRLVERHQEPFAVPPAPVTDIDCAIAEHIAELIPDEATIQMGIGAVPNAIGEQLLSKQHLGLHTEMINDAVMKLFDAGVLDGTRKTVHEFQLKTFFCAGSKELYDWLDDNPMVYSTPVTHNNNPWLIAQNDNMMAINAALEVDITGQCCSESFGPKQYTATGGQVDFTRGAWMSKGGKSFIALHATATDKETGEKISRIVPQLKPGAIVTLTRTDVMYVVTEFGCVCLKGKNTRERAQALTSIADPDFRSELIQYAKDVKYFILPEHEVF